MTMTLAGQGISTSHPTARVEIPVHQLDNYEHWQAVRSSGVTATDMRVLAGHGYAGETVYERWLSKVDPTNRTMDNDESDTPDSWMLGSLMEPALATMAEHKLGLKTARVGLLRHKEIYYLLASPDRIASDSSYVELKDSSRWYLQTYQVPDSEWTNEQGWTLPPAWRVQVRHQLATGGRTHAWVFAKLEKRFTWWRVDRDEAEEAMILELAKEFWDYRESGIAPPVEWDTVTAAEVKARYPQATPGKRLQAAEPAVVRSLIRDLGTLSADRLANEKGEKAIKTMLKAIAGDAEIVTDAAGVELFSVVNRSRAEVTTRPSSYTQVMIPKAVKVK